MKFLCLICAEKLMEWMSEEEAARHVEEYRQFTDELRAGGHLVSVNRLLLPPDAAVTVRVRNGRVSTTGGPFAETKEHLGGYYVVEANDLNEAIRIAAKIPGAKRGCVEVRPIAEDEATVRATGTRASRAEGARERGSVLGISAFGSLPQRRLLQDHQPRRAPDLQQ